MSLDHRAWVKKSEGRPSHHSAPAASRPPAAQVYNNSGLSGTPIKTEVVKGFSFELPGTHPVSAELTGTFVAVEDATYSVSSKSKVYSVAR